MNEWVQRITSRRGAWFTVVFLVLVFGGLIGGLGVTASNSSPLEIPSSSESAQVAKLQATLPSARETSAVVVYSRSDGPLTAADHAAITQRQSALSQLDYGVPHQGPLPTATSNNVAYVVVPIAQTQDTTVITNDVKEIRHIAATDLPAGLTVQVTGEAGFTADLANVFSGADVKLLLATVLVVALLLVITYRSPWLWLVPLFVIGMASQLAAALAGAILPHLGLTFDAATSGILSVLVFGAGTDYSFLLISRYRDELRVHEDRHDAMAVALRGSVPAILASGGTVVLSLLTLVFALIPSTRSLGVACAIGVAVAVVAALGLLPAVLVLFGRGLFWPVRPVVGSSSKHDDGYFGRLGRLVRRRALIATVLSVVVLGLLASGVFGISLGLSQSQSFRTPPESVLGQETLARAFPAGTTAPVAVISQTPQASSVLATARDVSGVSSATLGETNGTITQINVVLAAAPDTAPAYDTITALREAVHAVPEAHALVGGTVAQDLDSRTAWHHDRNLIIPLVLLVVFLVLLLVLRALVAPVLLLLTVVASYFAALGASQYLFHYVYKFAGVDVGAPLIAFIFLAALGSDYNIFLVTRVMEERRHADTKTSMVHALSVTGVVITSAGVLLAAVFAVLGVLPLITLTQVGVIVGLGVLLDTLLVRTVLVPALCFLTNDTFWWPRRVPQIEPRG